MISTPVNGCDHHHLKTISRAAGLSYAINPSRLRPRLGMIHFRSLLIRLKQPVQNQRPLDAPKPPQYTNDR